MPGFNQRGPLHEGPMTGRGLGRCSASGRDVVRPPDMRGNAPGYGRGGGRAMGRGRCRRTWWDVDAAGDSLQLHPAEDDMVQKVYQLEKELSALKNDLEKMNKQ